MNSYTLEKVTTLPESVQDFIEQGNYSSSDGFQARFISNTKLAYIVCGAHIDIIDTRFGRKISEWTFGAILKDTSTKIVCVKELTAAFKEVTLLAIGLECMITGGMICIFDLQSSKVLRAIQIKDKVTSLHVISNGDELTSFPGPLNNFDGALAVGTAGGDVLIVDMCRQAIDEARLPAGFLDIKNEIDPCQLMVLSVNDVDRIERHKEVADRNGNHLAVHINAIIGDNSPHFTLKGPKGDNRVQVNKPEVCVSALMYAPQLCSIFIGYNFGALQIWNLVNMRLIYTSSVYQENIPVSHFALQEPVDDPRAFCYFWAVYSSTEPYCKSFPIAILYSLSYESKDWHEGYGYIYQNLQSCSIRFQADLSVMDSKDCSDTPVGAQCIRLHAITKGISKDCGSTSLQEGNEDSYTLCLMVWNVWCRNRDSYTFLSVFDLNQWYKEQMPNIAHADQYRKYMANVRLSDLTNDHMGSNKYPLFDAHIDASSISQFVGAQRLEEHYYPTALAFDCWAINEFEIYQLHNRGYQRQFCKDIELCGPLALMKPSELYETSLRLGLTPIFMEPTKIHLTNLVQQREYLLSVALENRMKNWLCKCATSWGNGSHRSAGLSLDLLLNWAWQRASVLKNSADNLCVPLFDYHGEKLDTNASLLLSKCRSQILILRNLYAYICKKCTPFLVHPEITTQQWECLKRIFAYLDIQSWMINVGLLPESTVSSYSGDKLTIPYPDLQLRKYYNDRRSNLHILNQTKQLIKGTGFLYIDKLVDSCADGELEKEWQKVGGVGQYPPSSLQGLLRTYLLENIEIEQKHMILTYLFLDLAMTLDQDKFKAVIPTLIKFPTIFQLPTCTIKIVQAFWHLDHGELETAVEQLIDPMIKPNKLSSWHHKFVLRSLMLQDHQKLAHLYVKVCQPPINDLDDVILSITLYVSNNMVHEAFNLSRQHRGKGDGRLTRIIFQECLKTNQIDKLITCKMSRAEEEALFRFMEDIKYSDEDKFRSVYYLQKGRYFDFYNLLSKRDNTKRSVHEMEEDNFSEISSVVNTLVPNITKKIISHCLQRKDVFRNETHPKPMSVFLHNEKERMKYGANFMEAMVCKAKETWSNENTDGLRKWSPKLITGEDFPFIKTPTSFPPNYTMDKDMIYAKSVDTFSRLEDDESECPQPRKRIKLTHRESIDSPIARRAEESKIFELTKIETPIIQRNASMRDATVCQSLDFILTPQSILKVKSFRQDSMDRGNSTTPENLDEMDVESNVSFEHLKLPVPLMDTTELTNQKLNVTARKSLVRTPTVRFSGVRVSNSSTSSGNQSSPVDSAHNSLNIDPLPHITDTSVSHKAAPDSKNSSTDTFYSPDNTIDEEIETNKDNKLLQLNDENVTKSRISIPGSPSSRRSYKHRDTIDMSDRRIISTEVKMKKSDLETMRSEEVVTSSVEKLTPIRNERKTMEEIDLKRRQSSIVKPSVDRQNQPINRNNADLITKQGKIKSRLNLATYNYQPNMDLINNISIPSPPVSCSKILKTHNLHIRRNRIQDKLLIKSKIDPSLNFSAFVKQVVAYQKPDNEMTGESPPISASKILKVFTVPKRKLLKELKQEEQEVVESPDETLCDTSGINDSMQTPDTESRKKIPVPDSPKCRRSYKGDCELRSSPRLKKPELPASLPTSPTPPIVVRPSGRKSLTRQVLEHNTRNKLLTSIKSEATTTIETSVKKTIGNVTEVIVDKYESHNVVEKTEDKGGKSVAEKFSEESSKSVKRIVKEGAGGDALELSDDDMGMDVDEDVPAIEANKSAVQESTQPILVEEPNKANQEEEEVNVYEDLSSSSSTKYAVIDPKMNNFQVTDDLSYHESITIEQAIDENLESEYLVTNYNDYNADQDEYSSIIPDTDTTSDSDQMNNVQIEISDDDSSKSQKDEIITLDSSSSSKLSERFEPNLHGDDNNSSDMSFNDSIHSGEHETDESSQIDKPEDIKDENSGLSSDTDKQEEIKDENSGLSSHTDKQEEIKDENSGLSSHIDKQEEIKEIEVKIVPKETKEIIMDVDKVDDVFAKSTVRVDEIEKVEVKEIKDDVAVLDNTVCVEEKVLEEAYIPARRTRSSSTKSVDVTPVLPTRRTKRATSTDCTITTPTRRSLRAKSITDEKDESPKSATPKKRSSRTKSVDAILEEPEKKLTPKPKTRRASSILVKIEEEIKEVPKQRGRKKSEEYSTSRRLTRKQKEMMEKNMPAEDDGDDDSTHNDDMQTMDRIHLMDKNDFEGELDPDEEKLLQRSPVYTITGSSLSENVPRGKRAPSEISDAIPESEVSTPPKVRKGRQSRATTESPVHTPVRRGRSISIDVPEPENPADLPVTPSRRTRRTSQSSNISTTSTETRRSTRNKTKSDGDSEADTKGRKRVTAKTELEQITEESSQDTTKVAEVITPRLRGRPRKLT